MKTIYDINHSGIKLGEYIRIGRLEYWVWRMTSKLPCRKHLFWKFYLRKKEE